jgi:hypothetical protein
MFRVLAQGSAELIDRTPGLLEPSQTKLAELVTNRGRITDALVDLSLVQRR